MIWILLLAVAWEFCGLCAYVLVRSVCRGERIGWRVSDRRVWIPIAIVGGPVASIFALAFAACNGHASDAPAKW